MHSHLGIDGSITVLSVDMLFQNVGPPTDLAMSLRPLALRPRKTPLIPSCVATAERDGVMRRVFVSKFSPVTIKYAARKHSVPHIHM